MVRFQLSNIMHFNIHKMYLMILVVNGFLSCIQCVKPISFVRDIAGILLHESGVKPYSFTF